MSNIRYAEGVKKEKISLKKPDMARLAAGIWVFLTAANTLICHPPHIYQDIHMFKYVAYLIISGVCLSAMLISDIVTGKTKAFFENIRTAGFVKWAKTYFTVTDGFVLLFTLISCISLITAVPYTFQAFFGNEGRYCGFLFWFTAEVMYFAVSRHLEFKRRHLVYFILCGMAVGFLGFSDYFNFNLLGFKTGLDQENYWVMISTMGNLNTYTAVMSMLLPTAGALFVFSDDGWAAQLFYMFAFIWLVISIIAGNSDSAYLVIAGFFAFVPFMAFRTRRGIRRYIAAAAGLVSGIEIFKFLESSYTGDVAVMGSIFGILREMDFLKYIAVFLWILALVLKMIDSSRGVAKDAKAPKAFVWIWTVLAAAVIIGSVGTVTYFTLQPEKLPKELAGVKNILIITDKWGQQRWYIWKAMLTKVFAENPLYQKIFGCGFETGGIYLYNKYFFEVAMDTGFVLDSPHSGYIQMLIETGVLGFAVYMGMLIAAVCNGMRSAAKKNFPFLMTIAAAIVCFMCQSTVAVKTPCDMGILMCFVTLSGTVIRKKTQ